MNTLIVEDDAFKSKQIEEAIAYKYKNAIIFQATSLQDAIKLLYANSFEVVILDMAIPSHSDSGGTTDVYSQPVGGLDILLYLHYDNRKERVMILTQYPTIEYNREHIPLAKLKSRLEKDAILNLSAICLFGEDGMWKSNLLRFLEAVV